MAEPPCVTAAAEQAKQVGGGVVLLHDFDRGNETADYVLKATKLLLDAAEEYGWSVTTLGEMTRNGQGHVG